MRTFRIAAALAAAATLAATAAAIPATAAVSGRSANHTKLARINDPLATMGDQFGHGVAINAAGTEAIVGAYESLGGNGRAYLYRSTHGVWSTTPAATFSDPTGAGSHCGYSVALSPNGTTAYIAPEDRRIGARSAAGAVFVYKSSHGAWPKKPTLTINDPGAGSNDYFGVDVAVSPDGGTLAVGAPGTTLHSTFEVGAAYVYTASHGVLPKAPSASLDSPVSVRGFFGYNLSVSNNSRGKGVLVLGAYVTSVGSVSAEGAAYIYDSKSVHSWVLAKGGSLKDPGNLADDFFGGVVTIDGAGAQVLVGAQDETEKGVGDAGAVFTYDLTAGKWHGPVQTLDGPANSAANFASPAISTNGAIAVMGAGNEQVRGHNYAGEAFVYVGNGKTLVLGASIPDPKGGSPTGQEYFGAPSAVSANGDISVIAAPATTGSGGNPGPGAVYLYNTTPH